MENLIDELEESPGGAAALRYPPDCSECIGPAFLVLRWNGARDPA